MRVLVIPDCHLKPWMFEKATAIMSGERTDNAVCLMDIPDDFGKDDPDLYKKHMTRQFVLPKGFRNLCGATGTMI